MSKDKLNKKDNVKVSVRYAVSVPEKDLMNLVKGNASTVLRELCSTVKSIKKNGQVPQGLFDNINKLTDVIMSIANVVSEVQETWADALKKYVEEDRLPSDELLKLEQPRTVKRSCLTNDEKCAVERLRRKGFTIKDIGKTIHRAEKVVASYVHLLEKKASKKK